MENLVLSFNVVAPMLLMLAIGFVLNLLGFLTEEVNRIMNRVVALILLPVLVFNNIYSCDPGEAFNSTVMIFCAAAIAAEFIIALILVKLFEKDKTKCGVMLQGMFRSNYVIYGIPIAVSLYGAQGSSAAAILTSLVAPIYNVLAVVALELFRSGKIRLVPLLKKIITNPLIIASALGLIFSLSGLKLPYFMSKTVSDVAFAATPMAFIFLGATFAFNNAKEHIKQLSFTVIMRLVIFPGIMICAAMLLGIRDLWLVVILAVFASPTAVSSFSLSHTLGGDHKLAGNIVVFSSVCSMFTMFTWIFVLKSFAMI